MRRLASEPSTAPLRPVTCPRPSAPSSWGHVPAAPAPAAAGSAPRCGLRPRHAAVRAPGPGYFNRGTQEEDSGAERGPPPAEPPGAPKAGAEALAPSGHGLLGPKRRAHSAAAAPPAEVAASTSVPVFAAPALPRVLARQAAALRVAQRAPRRRRPRSGRGRRGFRVLWRDSSRFWREPGLRRQAVLHLGLPRLRSRGRRDRGRLAAGHRGRGPPLPTTSRLLLAPAVCRLVLFAAVLAEAPRSAAPTPPSPPGALPQPGPPSALGVSRSLRSRVALPDGRGAWGDSGRGACGRHLPACTGGPSPRRPLRKPEHGWGDIHRREQETHGRRRGFRPVEAAVLVPRHR